MPAELWNTNDVAAHLDVTRQRVHQLLREEGLDFPSPVHELPRATLWRRIDVERWAKRNGYPKDGAQ